MLNAAIVGLGRWGQVLVDSVQAEGRPKGDRIRFVRGVTRTPSKAAAFAERQLMPVGDDYAAALADPQVQAVVLATPHSQHAEQILAAAAAGKHVFVEKPLTLDKASAERAFAACGKAGLVLALGHNRRFLPAMQELKRMMDDGTLGQILHIEGNISGPGALSYPPGMWRAAREESPAGGMTAMGIHVVDAMIALCGPIAWAQAQSFRQALQLDIDDTTSMLFRFESGISGYLGTIAATAQLWRIQVFGTKGWAHMRAPDVMDVALLNAKPETRSYPKVDIERAELEAFANAVAGRMPYPLPAADAIAGVAALEAVIASAARDGARVAVA